MSTHTVQLTSDNFNQLVLQSDRPVLVDFGAEWCPPCQAQTPILNQFAGQYQDKLMVGTIDVDASPNLQASFGVIGLPTLILFQDGIPVKRIVGFARLVQLETQILPYVQNK